MEKVKLIQLRKTKGMSQQDMAERLYMDVSTYNRKEKGNVEIRAEEWSKIAEILTVRVEEIYEQEESHLFVFKDNATGNYLGTNHIYAIPESMLESQRKYIALLEAEVERLKEC
jgi:DNA-binding XRE family transcriptional regulator